jgi:serine/threonine-protein kinase
MAEQPSGESAPDHVSAPPTPPHPTRKPDEPTGRDPGATAAAPTVIEYVGPAPPGALPDRAGACPVVRELARGGMGAVLEAFDPDLERPITVKVLLPEHQEHFDLRMRFLEEARITGRLQHPGIAPVYGVGRLGDDRPFFTMKLVQGQTLAALLAGRPGLEAYLPRFVDVFLQVCQTIAFAHSQGIIHRDLKPSNIMVGRFGEVQVMDWGLAKVLARGKEASGGREPPVGCDDVQQGADAPRPPGEGCTRAGSVMGTLAFMAPEQARGEVDRLDERADVFGLGAILCVILTGRPPWEGRDTSEVRHQAARADLGGARERLLACTTDAPLASLALQCLAAEPEDRPRNAAAVAEALAAYRAGVQERLRAAELGRVEAQARAANERQARRWTLALAGSILFTLALVGAAGLWAARQRAARVEAIHADLRDAERSLEAARWAEARAAVDRAEARVAGGGPGDLARRIAEVRADLEMVARLEAIRLDKANVRKRGFDVSRAAPAYEKAFRDQGMDVLALQPEEAAERVASSSVAARLVSALDDWASLLPAKDSRKERLTAVARQADPDEWRNRFRDARLRRDRKALVELARWADVSALPPETIVLFAATLSSGGELPAAVELLRRAQKHHPQDFWINHDLAVALDLSDPPRANEAVGYYRAALAQRPDSAGVWLNLGWALGHQDRLREAEACYRQAIELKPDFDTAHANLGTVLERQGRIAEAEKAYRRALELHPRSATAWNNLGSIMERKRKLDEALECFRKAISFDPEYAEPHLNTGFVLEQQGKLPEAVAACRRGVKLQPGLARAHVRLGDALVQSGQVKEGLVSLRKAVALDPKNLEALAALGNALTENGSPADGEVILREAVRLAPKRGEAWYCLGNALFNQEHTDAAVACYRRAVALEPSLAHAHCNLGLALQRQGKMAEALASLERGHSLGSKRHGWKFPSARWVRRAKVLAGLEERLTEVLARRARPATAREWLNLALFTEKHRKAPAATARFYAAAFSLRPELAADVRTALRYNAACHAVTASLRRGEGAAKTDERERHHLLRQALTWLDADRRACLLVLKRGKPETREEVRKTLVHWLSDPDLAPLRDLGVLMLLSAEERQACERLMRNLAEAIRAAS